MNRREFVFGAAALTGAGVARAAPDGGIAAGASAGKELVQLAAECTEVGELCQAHCLQLLATGDTSLATCARSVTLMLAMCRALMSASAQGSSRLKEIARACGLVCRDCEAACKPHAGHHDICRRCMESCRACAAACEKVAA
ncbi:MAG TPA: Csp1 family four helix bundle copper storage protein [Myxococcaceae bacterium]|nr:Csp1 family four helix bundle copper storage protein [Myxococcaceae bacterium]